MPMVKWYSKFDPRSALVKSIFSPRDVSETGFLSLEIRESVLFLVNVLKSLFLIAALPWTSSWISEMRVPLHPTLQT